MVAVPLAKKRTAWAPGEFESLCQTYSNRLFRYIVLAGRCDPAAAQDILQDTLLTAFQRMPDLDHPEKVQAWLYGTASNIVKRYGRALFGRYSVSTEFVGLPNDLDRYTEAAPGFSDRVAHDVSFQDVLADLPEDLRPVLELQVEGLTVTEVAALLNLETHQVLDATRAVAWRLAPLYPEQVRRRRALDNRSWKPSTIDRPTDRYLVALRALSPRRREVIERHVYRHLRPAEIAKELGIKAGCARVHLHDALNELAQRLNLDRTTVVEELRQRAPGSHAA